METPHRRESFRLERAWQSPLGPLKSSGSVSKSQKATFSVRVCSRESVKSMRVTVSPSVLTLTSTPLKPNEKCEAKS